MKSYILLTSVFIITFLILFLILEAAKIPLLRDPLDLINAGYLGTAITGLALLAADVFLPVPSSLLMVAFGARYGFPFGFALSVAGTLLAAIVGFIIGRSGSSLVNKYVSEREQASARGWIQRWGLLALIVSRPIPLVAESVAIICGTTLMRWRPFLIGSLTGSLPAAIIYSYAGANMTEPKSGLYISALVIIAAGIFWLIGQLLTKGLDKES
jgi:uncharacterized membrane protein YdjX (TVP38/TMEM64 family)